MTKRPPSWRTCLCLVGVGLLFVQIGVRTHQPGLWGVGAMEMVAGGIALPFFLGLQKRRERKGSIQG
jgi:hypothetical protein